MNKTRIAAFVLAASALASSPVRSQSEVSIALSMLPWSGCRIVSARPLSCATIRS